MDFEHVKDIWTCTIESEHRLYTVRIYRRKKEQSSYSSLCLLKFVCFEFPAPPRSPNARRTLTERSPNARRTLTERSLNTRQTLAERSP
jgi:hypothetical protein